MTRNLAPLHNSSPAPECREIRLQFKVIGPGVRRKAAEPGPLRALVFHPANGWQGRRWARPIGCGMFEMTVPAPGTGSCCLFLDCAKPGRGHSDLPWMILQAARTEAATSRRTGA